MKRINGKHILLDTCILIHAAKNRDAFERQFFDFINKNEAYPIINEIVKFEFLRSANTKQTLDSNLRLLSDLLGDALELVLPMNGKTFKQARQISNLYRFHNISSSQISVADC